MATYGGSNIVLNGLILNLDAGNVKSYPGSGTTWSDLSGNSNNGTLVNTPPFSNINGGAFRFDAVNKSVNLGNILNYTSQNFTFSYWVYFNSFVTNVANQGPIVLYKGGYQQNGYYDQIGATGAVSFITNQSSAFQSSATALGVISLFTWYNICYVRNGSSVKIYLNGIDSTSSAGTHVNPASNSNNFTIALYQGASIYGNFTLANFANYNRDLSSLEVLQNYNALKSRFNL